MVKSCKNFKVRIKSAAALSVPGERKYYGTSEQFSQIWSALIIALQRSEDTEDFLEFKYSASLRTQLCHALLHLLSLADEMDLPSIRATVAEHGQVIGSYMLQYMKSGVGDEESGMGENFPERDSILKRAIEHLRSIEELSGGCLMKRGAVAYLEGLLEIHSGSTALAEV